MELIKFTEQAQAVQVSNKAGKGQRVMRAKEFKENYLVLHPEATRKELKKAFNQYYKAAINANVADLAALLTTGRFGVEAAMTKGAKTKITLVDKEALGSGEETPSLDKLVDGKTKEEIQAIIDMLLAKVA